MISTCGCADSVCCSYPENNSNEMFFYGFVAAVLSLSEKETEATYFTKHCRISEYLKNVYIYMMICSAFVMKQILRQ